MQSTVVEWVLGRVRTSLNEFEKSNLPGSIRSLARPARRAGRSVLLITRATKRLLSARMIKRNILYPIRNTILRNRPLPVDAGGMRYFLAPEGAVPLEMWSGRYFEKQELEFVLGVGEPGMTFVDVGANVASGAAELDPAGAGHEALVLEERIELLRSGLDNPRCAGPGDDVVFGHVADVP